VANLKVEACKILYILFILKMFYYWALVAHAMPLILATQEAEIRRVMIQSQPGQID
jgi:hypothetical protein